MIMLLFFSGCTFEAPLEKENKIKIDPALLGRWEYNPENDSPAKIIILKFSETEYIVDYQEKDHVVYYRAYPIKVGDFSGVQLQIIGDENGPIPKDKKDTYHVATYKIENDLLKFKILEGGRVNKEIKDLESLKKDILNKKDISEFFTDLGSFKLITEKK